MREHLKAGITAQIGLCLLLSLTGCGDDTPMSAQSAAPAGSATPVAKPSPVASHQYPADAEINQFLLKVTQDHHIAAHIDGDWVVFDASSVRANGQIVDDQSHSKGAVILQANMRVFVPQTNAVIIQPVVGFGKDRAGAVEHTEASYLIGTYHAILGAFVDANDEHVERQHRVIGGRERIVTYGDVLVKEYPKDANFPPDDGKWRDQLLAAIDASPMTPGLHWIDVYHGQIGEKEELEIQLDNTRWKEMEAQVRSAPWLKGGTLRSVRLFMVIQDLNDVTRPPTTAPAASRPTTAPAATATSTR